MEITTLFCFSDEQESHFFRFFCFLLSIILSYLIGLETPSTLQKWQRGCRPRICVHQQAAVDKISKTLRKQHKATVAVFVVEVGVPSCFCLSFTRCRLHGRPPTGHAPGRMASILHNPHTGARPARRELYFTSQILRGREALFLDTPVHQKGRSTKLQASSGGSNRSSRGVERFERLTDS